MSNRANLISIAAQQMAASGSPWQYAKQQDFTGGENRLVTPEFVAPNQVIQAVNCEITPEGVLQTRKGLYSLNTSLGTGPILSAFRYKKESGGAYLVVQHGTTLYAANYAGGTVAGSFVSIKTGLTEGAKLRGVVWKDALILTNGYDAPFRYNGTACADLAGTPPKSKYIAVYGARLWLVPITTPNVLQCSNLEDYGTWDVLDAIKIRDGDGDTITGLAPLPGGMVICKSNSVWTLYGTSRDNWYIPPAPTADNVGCYAPDSLVPSAKIFMGKDGFYSFDLAAVTRLPKTHDTVVSSMPDVAKQGAVAAHLAKENRVLMIFPDTRRTALNFELNYGAITSWEGLNASCVFTADAAGDEQGFVIGDLTNGVLNKLCHDDSDNGMDIETRIWTSYSDCGSIRDKVFRMFRPEFAAVKNLTASVLLYYDIDYSMLGGISVLSHVIKAALTWDDAKWDKNVWGPVSRVRDPLWIPSQRGKRISYGLKAAGRIKFLGYSTKFREIGYD